MYATLPFALAQIKQTQWMELKPDPTHANGELQRSAPAADSTAEPAAACSLPRQEEVAFQHFGIQKWTRPHPAVHSYIYPKSWRHASS